MEEKQSKQPIIMIGQQGSSLLKPLAIGVGVLGLAAGVYFYMKKAPGVAAGSVLMARFKFTYSGKGGTYVIQASLGTQDVVFQFIFNHVEGLTWSREIQLTDANTYTEELECPIPMGAKQKAYDAEALIRTPSMKEFEYLIKKNTRNAVKVS